MWELWSGIQRMIGTTGFSNDGQTNMENLTKYEFGSLQAARAMPLTTLSTVKYFNRDML